MILAHEKCLICGRPTTARRAAISPFLVERCGLETTTTLIRFCAICEFAFFERRLTSQEVAQLYRDYRGKDYNAQRLRHEPSYAAHIPGFDDPFSAYYCGRIRDLVDVLNLLPEIKPTAVLDFGGDGSIAARLFPGAEISHSDASAGSALKRERFDLIFCSQVFEHISEPRETIAEVARFMDTNGLLLLDLPRDYAGPLQEAFILQARHGGPMNQMHEHISFFSARAARELLQTVGLVTILQVETPFSPVTLTIAGKPGAVLTQQLQSVAPARRLQWTLDRIRDGQAAERNRLAGALAAIHQTLQSMQKIDVTFSS